MNQQSVKKNLIYNLLYQAFILVIPLITTPYISRIFEPDQIGQYSFTLSIATYCSIFGNLGASIYGQLWVSKVRNDKQELSKAFITVVLTKICTFTVSAVTYILFVYISGSYSQMYMILLIYILSQLLDITWFFQGLENFRITVSRNFFFKVFSVVLIFLFVKEKSDLYRYVVIQQGAVLLGNISLWGSLPKYVHGVRIKECSIIKNLKENIVYFIPTISTTIFVSLDKCMLGGISNSMEESGYYEQANKIYSMLVALVTALTVVILPRMTFLWNEEIKNEEAIKKLIYKALRYVSLIVLPVSVGVFGVSPILVPVFFGEGYEKCIVLLRIFCLMVVFTSFNSIISNQCMVSRGKQGLLNKFLIVSSCVNVLMNVILIYFHQSIGAVVASVVSEFILLVLIIIENHKFLPFKLWIKDSVKYSLFAIVMWMSIEITNRVWQEVSILKLFVEIMLGVIVYGCCLLISRDQMVFVMIEKTPLRFLKCGKETDEL